MGTNKKVCKTQSGACHTFNGATVERKWVNGKCEGAGCELFQHSPGGHSKGDGLTLMVDIQKHQLPAILSHVRGQDSPWAMLHIHDIKDKGALHNSIRLGPGLGVDVRLRKNVFSSVAFPYTNCTSDPTSINPEVCEARCVGAKAAAECCAKDLDVTAGIDMKDENPDVLQCSAEFTRARQQCMHKVAEDASKGLVCKHPVDIGTWRTDRTGWYDATTSEQKNTVRSKAKKGESRVYCPPLCDKVSYEPDYVVESQAMSEHAALSVAQELISSRQIDNMDIPGMENPIGCDLGCARQVAEYVKVNFAIVNIVFERFETETHVTSPAISVASLLGSIGGNLGLFVGASVMTFLEFSEYLCVAVISGAVMRCGIKSLSQHKSPDVQMRCV